MPNFAISLHDLQQWMRWIIVDPRGVDDALREPNPPNPSHPNRYLEPKVSAYHFIDGSEQLGAVERLSVYAEGYFSRIVESLESDFPLTKKILGDELFSLLINHYLKEHPSQTPNIVEIGKFLPNFVTSWSMSSRGLTAGSTAFQSIPYLADVINLEWNVVESFYANDEPNLDISAFSNILVEQWEVAQMTFDPSVRLLNCDWPVDVLWKNRENENFDTIKTGLSAETIQLCLYRYCGEVFVERSTPVESKVLNLFQTGCTLGGVTEQIDEDDTNNLMIWFAKWVKRGLIKQIRFL